MINLIPKEEKKRMTIDFYYRLAVLFLVMASFTALLASAALVPAYFLSSIKDSLASKKLETQKADPLPLSGEQSLSTIKNINDKLSVLDNAQKNKFVVSDKIINAIILKKSLDIKITQIVYEDSPDQGKKVSITGTAPSRSSLVSFRQALEDSPSFKNIDLPVSNFLKDTNIQFYLTLTPS